MVILQPAKTEGIWWEVEQTLARVGPERTLVCMVNFQGRQNDYEDFRLRAEATSRHRLPRSVGNFDAPTFLYFDADWTPHVAEIGYLSPLLWIFLHRAADFDGTLAPILDRAAGATSPPEKPRPARRGLRLLGFAECIFLFWAWYILASYCRLKVNRAVAPASAVEIAENVTSHSLSPAEIARKEAGPAAVIYGGRGVDYRIALEPGWRHLPPQQGQDLRFEADGGVSLAIIAAPVEDLSQYPEKYSESVGARLGVPITITSRSEQVFEGRKWLDFATRIDREGKTILQRIRVISDATGMLVFIGAYPPNDFPLERRVVRAFDSLVPPGAANLDAGRPVIFSGIALDYQIRLDHEWSRIKPPTNGDIAFATRGGAQIELRGGRARESLDEFPSLLIASIEKAFPARAKVVRNETRPVNGLEWREIDFEIAADAGPIERLVRAHSGDKGTLIAVATAKASDRQALASIRQALESLALPKVAGSRP